MKKRAICGIARDTLQFILEASRSSYPAEFAGLLQAEGEVITEVLILPGTESSRMSALIGSTCCPICRWWAQPTAILLPTLSPPGRMFSSSLAPETIIS